MSNDRLQTPICNVPFLLTPQMALFMMFMSMYCNSESSILKIGTISRVSYYHLKYCLRNKLRQATHGSDWLYWHYVGKPFYDTDSPNRLTTDLITSEKPFMMGHFGAVDSHFATWFGALNFMCAEYTKIDFDITMMGYGAYGLSISRPC